MVDDVNNKKNDERDEKLTEKQEPNEHDAHTDEKPSDTEAQGSIEANSEEQHSPEKNSEVKVQEPEESPEIIELKNQIDRLTQEAATYKDKWLRAEAELDNYKKRVHKERLEQLKYAYEGLIRELLPVIDNLERAIEYSKKHSQKDSLYEGVELTLKLLKKAIEGFGVNEIESVGKVFDPSLHEGVGVEEGEEYEDNVIVKELEKGYLYKDRLIRPAKVIVGKKALPANISEQT
ncbi:MAG: nucleotide exchange factor GrpE [bacterium]